VRRFCGYAAQLNRQAAGERAISAFGRLRGVANFHDRRDALEDLHRNDAFACSMRALWARCGWLHIALRNAPFLASLLITT
jgi:hypothetical protein